MLWNLGTKIGLEQPFNQKQVYTIGFFRVQKRPIKARALFDFAIISKLRASDLVELKVGDMVSRPKIMTQATMMQSKAGLLVKFKIAPDASASL